VNRRAPIIAGVVMLLIAVLSTVLLVLPEMGKVSETEGQLQAAQDEEISIEAELRALQEAEAQAPETEAAILAIDEQVPPTADLPELFRLLQSAADQSAVDFFSFSPGTPAPDASGGYSVIASQVLVTGSYFSIDEFLFLLETLPRAAKTISISVTPNTSGGGESSTSTSSSSTSSSSTSSSPVGLQLQLTVEFYTTDASAGPGSVPGPTEGISTTVPGV
jgi:Tfp pilus assembly protein PilO